ncbi:hypothetical protein OEK97_28285, partial [Escherichia coli]|uniref:hypothetical protein n=1 Tax=Escherichia coli TaxID=562 RepID=UPI0021D99E8C
GEEGKKGKIKFVYPAFSTSDLEGDVSKMADEFDKNELQPYLKGEDATEKEEVSKEENLF